MLYGFLALTKNLTQIVCYLVLLFVKLYGWSEKNMYRLMT